MLTLAAETQLTAGQRYPYYKRLYFVTSHQRSAAVERFIAFVQASEGRKILESNGQWIH